MKEIIEIDQSQILALLKKTNAVIVDIRDEWEFKDFNIGGLNIPAHTLNDQIEILSQKECLIIVCSNGTRSHIMARVINKKLPNTQIYHLSEGIM